MTGFMKLPDVPTDELDFHDVQAVVDFFDRDPQLQWRRVATEVIALRFDGRHWVSDSQTDHIAYGQRLDDLENPHVAVAGVRLLDRDIDEIMSEQDNQS